MRSVGSRRGPQRIVCLTEEPTEILYLLGEEKRIVGISAYTVRPPEAKAEHPVVSAFIGGSVDKICALKPDLIIGFSDIQAELAKSLIAANQQVLIFNQRSIDEILDVIINIGALVHRHNEAQSLVDGYLRRIDAISSKNAATKAKPRVYFEEWDEPTICGIRWVSELVEIAGGIDVFSDKSKGSLAKERFVSSEEIRNADPQIVFASWCGKAFDADAFEARLGQNSISAMQNGEVHEVPPEIILQPGPACLSDGLDFLVDKIQRIKP